VLKDQFAQVRKVFSSSLLAKAFATSFVSVHVPIIFILAYVAAGGELNSKLILSITLAATILGTAIAFLTMHKLLSPLSALTNSLRDYRTSGAPPKFGAERMDDIGRLTTEFQDLVGALEQKISLLKRQAYSDPLTALGNRRWLAEAASTEIARARRARVPLSVIAFDLDHFKRVNDDFGHDVGDTVLIAVAETAKRILRPYDLVARIGGEEFCALLPETDMRQAAQIADRLRLAIAALQIGALQGRQVTASIGIHEARLLKESFRDMLRLADEQLYEAKAAGRNRIAMAPAATGVFSTEIDMRPNTV
jgi:diguanylate cyclase (GGDEF)-like protein